MWVLRISTGMLMALVGFSGMAQAEDLALIYGDRGQIEAFQDPDTTTTEDFTASLKDAGFRVIEPRNRSAANMQLAAQVTQSAIENGPVERLVIVVMGPIASDGRDSWVMSNDAEGASGLSIGRGAVSLNALSDMATSTGGRAVMLIAPGRDAGNLGPGLVSGLGEFDRTEGVTYATGPAGALAGLLGDDLLDPETSFAEIARSAPRGVEMSGFLSDRVGLMGEVVTAASPQAVEQGYWAAVQAIDKNEGYEVYLRDHPKGQYRAEAQERIKWLKSAPERQAQDDEAALNLTRDARREIQRNLSLLGYNPRGIDGVFGKGSRSAIGIWQRASGYEETGFLTGNQLLRLRDQANARAAELEREAEARRIEEERRDRAYWRETGRGGDEAGLRAYLERYPDGEFADIAGARLGEIEDARRSETAREEGNAWDQVRATDTTAAYRGFLRDYPQSGFAEAAKARLRELQHADSNAAEIENARAEERQIAGIGVARMLIEQRLAQVGAKPGKVDGKFNKQTRQAIRRFQRSRQLPVTGFVSKATMVQLMGGR